MNKNKSAQGEYQNYVVTFLDVLGQREVFNSLEKFPIIVHSEEFQKALGAIHVDATQHIKSLRDNFANFFKKASEERPIPDGVPQDKIEEFKEMRKSNLKYKTFSDSMQFFASLKTDRFHCQAMNSVFAMLTATGGMLLATLAEKKVFRAGIDIGVGIEIEEDEVYGPALFRAYDLEDRVAQWPRIVIGEVLISYLQDLVQKRQQIPNQSAADLEACKMWAEYCFKSLKRDIDGYMILDYLSENFSLGLKNAFGDLFDKYFDLAFNFIQSEYLKFKEAKNTKMSQRYYWLCQYFSDFKNRSLK